MNGEASSVSAEDGAWNGSPRQGAQRPGSAQGGQVEKTAMLDKSIDSAELKQVGIATGRARKVPHVGADVQDGCSLHFAAPRCVVGIVTQLATVCNEQTHSAFS